MKNRTLIFGALLVGAIGMTVGVFASVTHNFDVPVSSGTDPYQIQITSNSQVSSGVTTALGNKINFTSSELTSSSGVGSLAKNGFIYNTTKISGLARVDVTLTSGSVDIYYGKNSNSSWDDSISGSSFDLNGIFPNYFKVVATSASVIESITLTYACYDYQAEAATIDYKVYVNGQLSTGVIHDATKPDEGYDKQYKVTLDVLPGDVLTFTKNSSQVYPSANGGEGNNAYKVENPGYLIVKNEVKGADLYFKVTGSNYDVWLSGVGSETTKSDLREGAILQAWNWSVSAVQANLDAIADAGYRTIQLSPLQVRPGPTTSDAWRNHWWELYQPYGFSVATSSSQSVIGTKSQLTSLCAAAKAKGIGVIVDVVVNHLAGDNWNTFSSGISTYESTIYANKAKTYMHQYGTPHGEDGRTSDDTQQGTIFGAIGGFPDLDTGKSQVMERVLSLFNEYLDCGVSGFRIDAAKHVETPQDGGYSSIFWPYVVNGSKRHAMKKGYDMPFYYGEALGAGNDRNLNWYTPYMMVTEGSNAYDLRDGVNNGNISLINGNYYSGVGAENSILWAESHDEFQSSTGSWLGETNVNKVYAIQASRGQAVPMYMARPNDDNTKMGSAGNNWWKDPAVAAVNQLHSRYTYQNEYVEVNWDDNKCFVNVRGSGEDAGALIANIGNSASNFSVHLPNMANGTYRDLVSGDEYNVQNNYTTVKNVDCGVIVLVPSVSSNFYLVGNTIYTGTSASWTKESGRLMTKTNANLAEIHDIRIEAGAAVKALRVYDDSRPDGWYDGNFASDKVSEYSTFCTIDGDANLLFSVGGTYSIFLNNQGVYYITGTPDSSPEPEPEPFVPVGTDYYIRGTAVGSWDTQAAYRLMTSSDTNNIGEILNVTLSVGDFKIANASWSQSWGWGYKNPGEASDHEVVQGSAKANFEQASSDYNIHCKVAGTYNLYLTTNNYLFIVAV